EAPSRYAFLDFMADCVIHVDQRVTAQVATRRLRVIKYRGSGYGRNEYPFIISENGINVIPITSNVLQHRPPGPKVSSGQARLDDILAGGYKRGTSILIVGTAGAGKTTLACVFAQAACLRGERVLNACKERGITCIYLNQATGLDIVAEISGIGFSIIDTVILLRHLPIDGAMKRQLVVMKSRGSKHSEQFHEFQITDRGIDLVKA